MEAEDIERRDFFVSLRGYDRDEVDQFLADVAAELRAARAEIETLRNRPEPPDPFERLGSNVTAILRAANDSATGIVASAKAEAETIRATAVAAALRLRKETDEYVVRMRNEVTTETKESRRAIGEAHAQALDVIRLDASVTSE